MTRNSPSGATTCDRLVAEDCTREVGSRRASSPLSTFPRGRTGSSCWALGRGGNGGWGAHRQPAKILQGEIDTGCACHGDEVDCGVGGAARHLRAERLDKGSRRDRGKAERQGQSARVRVGECPCSLALAAVAVRQQPTRQRRHRAPPAVPEATPPSRMDKEKPEAAAAALPSGHFPSRPPPPRCRRACLPRAPILGAKGKSP